MQARQILEFHKPETFSIEKSIRGCRREELSFIAAPNLLNTLSTSFPKWEPRGSISQAALSLGCSPVAEVLPVKHTSQGDYDSD